MTKTAKTSSKTKTKNQISPSSKTIIKISKEYAKYANTTKK